MAAALPASDDPAAVVELALAPFNELRATGIADEYESLGDDPWFLPQDDRQLAAVTPGWWLLRWELPVLDGWIVTPCAYFDFGDGLKEADSVRLREPDRHGYLQKW